MSRDLSLLLPVLLLAACASATPYQPMDRGNGYSEQKLESNRYRIEFHGNSSTPRETVENYLLYRAAELTLNNGYDWFSVAALGANAEQKRSSVGFSVGGFSLGSRGGFGVGVGTGTGNDPEYQGSALVTMGKGRKPEGDVQAYEAREIKANLESRIARPQAGN